MPFLATLLFWSCLPRTHNSTAYLVGLLGKAGDRGSSATWSPVSQQGCRASEPQTQQEARHEAVGKINQLSRRPDAGFLPFCPLLHVVLCPLFQFSGRRLHLRCWVCVWLVQFLLVTARRSECPTCCLMGTFHPAAELVSVIHRVHSQPLVNREKAPAYPAEPSILWVTFLSPRRASLSSVFQRQQ